MRLNLLRCLFLVCLVGSIAAPTQAAAQEIRTWKSADGKFSVQATLVATANGVVRLKRTDTGKMISVPLKMLGAEEQKVIAARYAEPKPDAPQSPAAPTTPTAAKPVAIDDLQPQDVGLQILNDTEYRLAPFGKIEIPADGMLWKVASRKPPVFIAQKPNDPQAFIVTMAPPVKRGAKRVAFAKANYNTMVTQLKAAGIENVRGDKLQLGDEPADRVKFALLGDNAAGGQNHFITEIQFHPQFTVVFQATSTNADNAAFLIENAKTFVPEGPATQTEMPQDVKEGVTAAITQLQTLLAAGDTEKVLDSVIPDDVRSELKANQELWQKIVADFQAKKGPELAGILKRLDWAKATYDAQKKVVTFPINVRGVKFKQADGKWQLQN